MNIKYLVIGNKGSFLEDFIKKLEEETQKGDVEVLYCHTSMSKPELELKIDNSHVVIYLGGETRFEDRMVEFNYTLPKLIFEMCAISKKKFVYLSSLSVFGYNKHDTIDLLSNRDPIDFYGITKNKLDQFIKGEIAMDINVCTIYPASINSGRGRSSIEKFEMLMETYPLLRCLSLAGKLSVISRGELISRIFEVVKNEPIGEFIVSEHVSLNNYAFRYALPVPKLPNFFFNLLRHLFGAKLALLAKTLNRGIHYGKCKEK